MPRQFKYGDILWESRFCVNAHFMKKGPTFIQERILMSKGYTRIVGGDEAGCGALAGPVVAGAVIFPPDSQLERLNDSKCLSVSVREELYDQITDCSIAWSVGVANVQEIFSLGIRPATYLAMRRAVLSIHSAEFVLVDAWTIPDINIPQKGIIRGDSLVKSIAAASIIAKVTRDRMMKQLANEFPVYGFDQHKGYGTKFHREAIQKHGPCNMHRHKFKLT